MVERKPKNIVVEKNPKNVSSVERKPKNLSKRQLDRFDKEFLPIHSSAGQSRFKKLKSKDK